jgi:hypothetical protein
MAEVRSINLMPGDASREAMYDVFRDALTIYMVEDMPEEHMPVAGFIDEMATFIKLGDDQFMSLLADIYDNPPQRTYRTKGRGREELFHPSLALLGGITLTQLRERFNSHVMGGGFPARIILVYSDEEVQAPLDLRVRGEGFGETEEIMKSKESLRKALVHDLEAITLLDGEFHWESRAAEFYQDWYASNFEPKPTDVRLSDYNKRKIVHVAKVCMAMNAATRDDMTISLEDMERTKELLERTERAMPHAVAGLETSDSHGNLIYAKTQIESYYAQHKKGIPHYILKRMVSERVSVYELKILLDQLVDMRWCYCEGEGVQAKYFPYPEDS